MNSSNTNRIKQITTDEISKNIKEMKQVTLQNEKHKKGIIMSIEISQRTRNGNNSTTNRSMSQWDEFLIRYKNQSIQLEPPKLTSLIFPMVMIVLYMSIACWFACPNQNALANRTKRRTYCWNNSNEPKKPASGLPKDINKNKNLIVKAKTSDTKMKTTTKTTKTVKTCENKDKKTKKNVIAKKTKQEGKPCFTRSGLDLTKPANKMIIKNKM